MEEEDNSSYLKELMVTCAITVMNLATLLVSARIHQEEDNSNTIMAVLYSSILYIHWLLSLSPQSILTMQHILGCL